MLKLLMAITFLGAGAPCFSNIVISYSTTFSQRSSWSFVSEGNEALLSGNSRLALRHFNDAFQHVDTTSSSSLPVDVLIAFGQVIAYDHQGDRTLCKQALGSLILATQNWSNRLELDSESSSYSSSNSSYTSYSTDDDFQELQNFLTSLISIAPSNDVKELLTDVSSFLIEDLYPYFNTDKQSF